MWDSFGKIRQALFICCTFDAGGYKMSKLLVLILSWSFLFDYLTDDVPGLTPSLMVQNRKNDQIKYLKIPALCVYEEASVSDLFLLVLSLGFSTGIGF